MDKKQEVLEHAYIKKTQNMIEADIIKGKSLVLIKNQEYEEQKKIMFEDAVSVIRDNDDKLDIYEKNTLVDEKATEYYDAKKKLDTLYKQQNSPYFGRFDFKKSDSVDYKPFYIGKFSYCDNKTMDYYIYDWRAPVSSLYYEYDTGDACYNTPVGMKQGDISLKRLFNIENGSIKYMYDAESLARDEILAQTLSQNTSQNLRVIIHSIQEEQNKAIRYPLGKHMLITGPAGSGKTSVGLHRLAYILYHNRSTISSSQIAILSNNNVFCSYISTIIPELGEDGVTQVIYMNILKEFLPEKFHIEDFYLQTELIYTQGRQSLKAISAKIKSSYKFLKYIINYIDNMSMEFKDIVYAGEVIISKEHLEKKYNKTDYKSYSALKLGLYYYVENEISRYFNLNKAKFKNQIYEISDEFLIDDQLNSTFQSQLNNCINDAQIWFIKQNNLNAGKLYPIILNQYLSELSSEDKEGIFQAQSINIQDEFYEKLIPNMDRSFLSYEDANALLCVKILLGEVKPMTNVKEVLIDEAQDYSAMQLFNIKHIYNNSHQTLLADINQSITPDVSASLSNITKTYESIDMINLYKSYRSSGPINRFANTFMNTTNEIEYFDRDGNKPVFVKTSNNIEAIKTIIEDNIPNDMLIGILTISSEYAEEIYSGLNDNEDIQLIINADETLSKRIVVLPVVFAKGLEFDAVIIADFTKSEYQNMQYLMCTRALHLLYILGEDSKEIPDASEFMDIINVG